MVENKVGDGHDNEDPNSETISLDMESAREDNLEEVDKLSEKEQILLQQVESLTKGLEEMKSQIRREKMASTKHSLAAKIQHKMLRSKLGSCKQKKPVFEAVKRKAERKATVNSPAEVKQMDVQWEEVMDSNVQQWPDKDIQPTINALEGKPVVEELQLMVEVTDVMKTFADSVSEFMEMGKEQVIFHYDELASGYQLVANETDLGTEEVAGTQVTASEPLAFLCDNEENTEKTDELVDSKKTEFQDGDNHKALEDGVMGNKVLNGVEAHETLDDTTDQSYVVQGKDTDGEATTAQGDDVHGDELKGDKVELSSNMKALQEGVKNIVMGDHYQRSNSEVFSENDAKPDDEQPTDDDLFQTDDDEPTKFLGDDGELSDVDEEEEKLLAGGGHG